MSAAPQPQSVTSQFSVIHLNDLSANGLGLFMSLSGQEHDIAWLRSRDDPLNGLARSGSICTSMVRPVRTSSMMASGSSERGLSEVRTHRSLSKDTVAPIFGLLLRSRSPPHPNSVQIWLS